MQLVSSLPEFVNRLITRDRKLLLTTDNAIFELDLETSMISEKGRWTGANIQNVEVINSTFIVGTDKGLILFDGEKQQPVWTGDKTIVVTGDFSENVKGFALSLFNMAGRKYLKPMVIRNELLEGKVKKLWTMDKIPFFTPYGGFLNEYIVNYILSLTHKLDIDGDGNEELLIITPSIENSYLLQIKVSDGEDKTQNLNENNEEEKTFKSPLEITHYPLPAYTFRPMISVKKDVDLDGFHEIVLLSNPEDSRYTISMIKFPLGKPDIQVILQFDIKEIFPESTEDGEIWFNIGDLNGDEAQELLFIWEEKPDIDELYSRIYLGIVDFFGERKISKTGILDYPIVQTLMVDIDGDSRDELLLLTPFGISVWRIIVEDDITVKKLRFIPLMDHIEKLGVGEDGLIAYGPVISKNDEENWVVYKMRGRGFKISPMIPKPTRIVNYNDEYLILTNKRKLLSLSDQGIKPVLDNVYDLNIAGGEVYLCTNNGYLWKYSEKGPEKIEKIFEKAEDCKIGHTEKDGLILFIKSGDLYKCISIQDKKERLKIDIGETINNLLFVEKENKTYYIISTESKIIIFDNMGKKLVEFEKITLNDGKYVYIPDENGLLLILSDGFLYSIEFNENIELKNHGYKNWSAIAYNAYKKEFYISYQDGVYSATIEEVL